MLTVQSAGRERAIELLAERAVAAAETASNLKQTLWVTSITTILAVLGIALAAYFGTQASNIAIVQTTLAAFESGRTTGSKAAENLTASGDTVGPSQAPAGK
jgi:zinc transporter ZupT